MAYNSYGTLRKLVRYDLKVYPTRLNAAMLHFYDCALLGKIPQIKAPELFSRMVHMAVLDRNQYWVRMQRQMGGHVRNGSRWVLHH